MASHYVSDSNGHRIGAVSLNKRLGWFFISYVQNGNSRKPQPTAEQAIPRWAKKRGAQIEGTER